MNLVSYVRENAGTVLFYGEQHFLVVLFAIALGSAISVAFALLVSTAGALVARLVPRRDPRGRVTAALTVPVITSAECGTSRAPEEKRSLAGIPPCCGDNVD